LKGKDMQKKRHIKRYGWVRDLPDTRDFKYSVKRPDEVVPIEQLPASIDLRPKCPPVYDQGDLGSCTANACAGAIQFLNESLTPSRLFVYYNERSIEGTTDQDSGGQLRDVVKAAVTDGACDESIWPYDIAKFTQQPPTNCYQIALKNVVTQYLKVVGEQEMKSCLAAGFPFIFGFSVYSSFESSIVASTGIVPMPGPDDSPVGGHAVMCAGYNLNGDYIVRNSWGPSWGQAGYFIMPRAYIIDPNQASDFWTIRAEGIQA
jgi:C1A family cysteine protease